MRNPDHQQFSMNLEFLKRNGVIDMATTAIRSHAQPPDVYDWRFDGRQFRGSPAVDLNIHHLKNEIGGRVSESIGLAYDGKSITIQGAATKIVMELVPDSPRLSLDQQRTLGVALEESFLNPRRTFLSNEELASGD